MSDDLAQAYNDVYQAKKPNRKDLRVGHWPRNRKQACVRFAPGGRRVLDVGCGSGVVLYNLRDKYDELCGVELSEERVKTAVQTLASLNARVQLGNLERGLDFADGYFDAIVISDVIEHLVNLWPATQEMTRLLAPGGKVIVTTPNIASLQRRLELLRGVFPSTSQPDEGFGVRSEKELFDGGHLHYFTFSMLRKLFARYGYSRVEEYGIGRLGRLHQLRPSLLSSCCTVVATR